MKIVLSGFEKTLLSKRINLVCRTFKLKLIIAVWSEAGTKRYDAAIILLHNSNEDEPSRTFLTAAADIATASCGRCMSISFVLTSDKFVVIGSSRIT